MGINDLEDGEFRIRREYSSRKLVIATIWSYTISRRVNYVVYESEPQMFYTKCKTYELCCEIRRYNGRHTKDLTTPLVTKRLGWQSRIAKVFSGWEESYQALSLWFSAIVQKMLGSQVQIEI
ncbi:hypothetical protein Ahy_B05g078353 [Arachis hypogaea]|uniref:Uncharacterized protein n=1 Tax=Arachis hypogaea TaxID=3818 RepID=A0A444Z6W2_ARAHY|nr:hypothetical protein Ahy_B05g078353 [Arachis hypogaea]